MRRGKTTYCLVIYTLSQGVVRIMVKSMAHPEGRTLERRTIQPTDSKSVRLVSTLCYGVLQRPYSLESRGIIVQAVHGVYAVSQILHRNCTGNIKGKATRLFLRRKASLNSKR